MQELQLTMFDEVTHPLLKDFKCMRCGSKDVKVTACSADRGDSIEGVYRCITCKGSESFLINKIKEA